MTATLTDNEAALCSLQLRSFLSFLTITNSLALIHIATTHVFVPPSVLKRVPHVTERNYAKHIDLQTPPYFPVSSDRDETGLRDKISSHFLSS